MSPSVLAILGLAILVFGWLPLFLERLPVSLPMAAVAAGFVVFKLFGIGGFALAHRAVGEQLITFVLIVAVMEAGLAIDRPFGVHAWGSTWRLLGGAMPLSVIGIAGAACWLLNIPLGVAVLLGGILAPTDPVLARAVQVGPPGVGEEGEVRFALTSEAGLNDGLAFPFVLLGLAMIAHGGTLQPDWIMRWALVDGAWKILAAVAIGFLLGWLLVRVNNYLPEHFRLSRSREGLVAIGLAFLAYGVSELAHAYGFVAVFVTAATLRNLGRSVDYARRLHAFAEQGERLAMVVILGSFGGAIAGGLLSPLTWWDFAFAVLVLIVIRPLACLISFARATQTLPERLALGLLGIRGLGSFFYTGYALTHELPDEWGKHLWALTGLVVLLSLVIYGVGADPLMQWLGRRSQAEDRPENPAASR